MTNGWVRLHKSTLENLFSYIEKGELTVLDSLFYLHCLAHVNFKKNTWRKKNITVKRGEMVTSKTALAKACVCKRETVIHSLRRLEKLGLIKVTQLGKELVLTVMDYDAITSRAPTVQSTDTSTDSSATQSVHSTDTSTVRSTDTSASSTVQSTDTSTVRSTDTLLDINREDNIEEEEKEEHGAPPTPPSFITFKEENKEILFKLFISAYEKSGYFAPVKDWSIYHDKICELFLKPDKLWGLYIFEALEKAKDIPYLEGKDVSFFLDTNRVLKIIDGHYRPYKSTTKPFDVQKRKTECYNACFETIEDFRLQVIKKVTKLFLDAQFYYGLLRPDSLVLMVTIKGIAEELSRGLVTKQSKIYRLPQKEAQEKLGSEFFKQINNGVVVLSSEQKEIVRELVEVSSLGDLTKWVKLPKKDQNKEVK